jgi:hypothetical protein
MPFYDEKRRDRAHVNQVERVRSATEELHRRRPEKTTNERAFRAEAEQEERGETGE